MSIPASSIAPYQRLPIPHGIWCDLADEFRSVGEDIRVIAPETLHYWIVRQGKSPKQVVAICLNKPEPKGVT